MTGEVIKALEEMQRGKTAGEKNVTTELLKYGGEIVLEKLATSYTKWLFMRRVPESCKNAKIAIYKKGDANGLRNYWQITLLSTVYKLECRPLAM